MKKVLTSFSIAITLIFSILFSQSFSEAAIAETIKLNHIPVSSFASGNLFKKEFRVKLTNISNEPLINVKIKLDYVAGCLGEDLPALDVGNIFAGDIIEIRDIISVEIDRSQLTNGLFVYTWLVEYETTESEHILDEYLIEETE